MQVIRGGAAAGNVCIYKGKTAHSTMSLACFSGGKPSSFEREGRGLKPSTLFSSDGVREKTGVPKRENNPVPPRLLVN